jgi:hypothetical protein
LDSTIASPLVSRVSGGHAGFDIVEAYMAESVLDVSHAPARASGKPYAPGGINRQRQHTGAWKWQRNRVEALGDGIEAEKTVA